MANTVIIKSDRVTFATLTADPATVTSGDYWYRSDLQRFKIAIDTVVANAKIVPITPITSGDIASGAIASAHIASGAIASAHIASGAVATGHIVDSAITSPKIASGAIATGHIVDSAITSAKIANGAVIEAKIASGAVTSAKIASGAIASAHIGSGVIATGHIADSAVTSAKIGSGAVSTAHIADSAVTTAKTNFTNQALFTTSSVSFAQVSVGDLVFEYGWRITESPDALIILKDGVPILTINKKGKITLRNKKA